MIRIYSWFVSGNIGDILIAEQIKQLFSSICDCEFYDIVSGKPAEETKVLPYYGTEKTLKDKLLKNTMIRELLSLRGFFRKSCVAPFKNVSADVAVFAGGNSLMELSYCFGVDSIILNRRLDSLKKNGVKIAYCFAGCGPFNGWIGKIYAKKIISKIDFFSFRDTRSYDICKKYGWKQSPVIWVDPVLTYQPDIDSFCEKDVVAVNVYFGDKKHQRTAMFQTYTELIEELLECFPDKKIVLYVTESADTPFREQLGLKFTGVDRVCEKELHSPEELFSLYAQSSVVIGTRMHSLITAIVSDIPVAAIAWQNKVFSLMELLNKQNYMMSQKEFISKPRELAHLTVNAMQRYPEQSDGMKQTLEIIREQTLQNTKLFCDRWRK